MTKDGWSALAINAVANAAGGRGEQLDLLALLLEEQDLAKQGLRDLGFGVTGTPWLSVVDEVAEFVDEVTGGYGKQKGRATS